MPLKIKEQKREKILAELSDRITGISDLAGVREPSAIFSFLVGRLGFLLSDNPDEVLSKKGVRIRRKINGIFKKVGTLTLKNKQIIENYGELLGGTPLEIDLPDEPVIWCANHGFIDDVLATVLAAKRHAYILFASLLHFFNTPDGITAYINGVVMINRKNTSSKQSSVNKAVRAMSMGADLIVCPEGVWNKTPDKLMLDLWPGVYRISRETGCKVVPVIHYLDNPHKGGKENPIHTVVTPPLDISVMLEQEGLQLLRDTMASYYYLLMEKYGKGSRKELLGGFDTSHEAWESYIAMHTAEVLYYDTEIEFCADYRVKWKTSPEEVWLPVAQITNESACNMLHIKYAQEVVETQRQRDYQHRY